MVTGEPPLHHGAPPPEFPATTIAFDSLFRAVGQPAHTLMTCGLDIRAGEVIGVLGATGSTTMNNSYGPTGQFQTSILGMPTTLTRMGMQFNLANTAARDLFSNASFEVSRIRMHVQATKIVCYPDCDTSTGVGTLDIFDFLCFANRYDALDPYACDCDSSTGPSTCDIFDFLCFQNAYSAGCD